MKSMKTSYFLDTSTFRAIPSNNLNNIKASISPYTFWEILCHLDEEDFEKQKRQLLKCLKTNIVDDPFLYIYYKLNIKNTSIDDRTPDNEIITKILLSLQNSNSLENFYKSTIIDNNGNIRKINNCAKQIRSILDNRAKSYFGFAQDLESNLMQGEYNLNSDEDCHKIITALMGGESKALENYTKITDNIRSEIFNTYYLYYAYLLGTTKDKIENNIQHKRNNYEDWTICLHLHLQNPIEFVTNDKKLFEITQKSIKRLERLKINYLLSINNRLFTP